MSLATYPWMMGIEEPHLSPEGGRGCPLEEVLSPHVKKGDMGCANGSCPTTAGLLGEATEVIHDDNSCSLSDTSVVLSAMLSVSPTEELKTGNCAARQSGFKSQILLCVLE